MNTLNKLYKIISLFLLFVLGIVIFWGAFLKIIIKDRRLPKLVVEEKNRAIRGSIVTSDGYQVVYSTKLYKVAVNTRCIDPKKKSLFIKLFSIYSGIPQKKIRRALRKSGYTVLSYRIDAKTAYQLKILGRKLYQMDMFIPYKVGKRVIKQGLTILESGESRNYPYKDVLTPVIGYVRKYEEDGYTRIAGVKGIEKYYEDKINPKQDGLIKGKRDVGNNIILNKEALIKRRYDGYNVHLHINMLLQKSIENILDVHKKDLDAKEILATIMDSTTGKIIAMATSNRFDPKHITRKDYSALNPKFIEYEFEPGSVMKPIIFALLLEHKLVSPLEVIRGYNGRYKLGKKVITDEHKFQWLSAENVIVHSSNIGIAQLAQRLPADLYWKGLRTFGFGQKTGIDLPYERRGSIIPIIKLKSEIYKATVAYGYGIRVTFMQLLRAYEAFNNDGDVYTPRLGSFLSNENEKKMPLPSPKRKRIISLKTATTMNKILQKVVKKGTGTIAQIDGLQIGGKTGTAHMVRKGRYVHIYNSSFFGFANDDRHRYTIGITVIDPKRLHFASQTAVPVFRDVVLELVNEGYLVPQRN